MTGIKETYLSEDLDRFYVGIDAGAVSLNSIVINSKRQIVYESPYKRHLGKVETEVLALIHDLYARFGEDRIESVSFTGNHGRTISDRLGAFFEFETISQVIGTLHIKPDVRTIISMGGQDTALFQIKHLGLSWELEYFNTNGPCASGTGSFIDQQAQRLATSMYSKEVGLFQAQIDGILTDFIKLGLKSANPANVACRCTVFTKSDMIHLQNKGEKLQDIIYGLHVGNARNYMSTIVSNRALEEPIAFIGGLTLNKLQEKAFKDYFPGMMVLPYSTSVGALGVALQALDLCEQDRVASGKQCAGPRLDLNVFKKMGSDSMAAVQTAPRLKLKQTVFPAPDRMKLRPTPFIKNVKAFLGIDIGSTTTKYVLMDESRRIIHKRYVPTQGRPIEVVQTLFRELVNERGNDIEIAGIATTGSGRNVVGDFLNADLVIDEITAHARGAVQIDKDVDTIFEIGGQDSKYIHISNGYPLDFDMNKVCAAGTGSFLHELSNKYGINIIDEFQEIALSSGAPVKLAERCTVFMESDLVSYHQKGVKEEDLIAGLCYAIVHNYLNRVVGKRKIGRKVMFLGGPSLNRAVVAAFENILRRGILVPEDREVLGAYGAALSVETKMRQGGAGKSGFRGLVSAVKDSMDYTEKTCHADPNCFNECKLKIYDFDGRRSVWGGECGRYDQVKSRYSRKKDFFKLRQEVWHQHITGVYEELQVGAAILEIDGRPTVGMQKALYGYQTSVLWAHFFDQLGFRLVLTPDTNSRIARAGIETMVAETCYPVKVSHGHVKELIGKTAYLFLPSLITMPVYNPSEQGFYCPMVQSNAYMVRMAFDLNQDTTVLSPVVHLKYEIDPLAMELSAQLQSKLGVSKRAIRKALSYALSRQEQFTRELHQTGRQLLETGDVDGPLVVVTGRPYNLYDENLNLRIGKNLARLGMRAVPMDFIDVSSVDLSDFSSMYWGSGAQILRTARFVKDRPDCFGLHVTNFGCGADSFVEHFYKHTMEDKPYLILELDEHSAVAGVMTRLEAYKNVIENSMGVCGQTCGRLGNVSLKQG
jgi:predicted CoA-substrate-specific enzyme activase